MTASEASLLMPGCKDERGRARGREGGRKRRERRERREGKE